MKGTSKGFLRILVAEDEPTIRALLQESLQAEKYYVKACEDGVQALQALEKASFSVLVLDWMMPRMSGLELVRSLRAQGENVPVVLLAELDTEVARSVVKDLSLVTVLKKPFEMGELKALLRKVAGRSRA